MAPFDESHVRLNQPVLDRLETLIAELTRPKPREAQIEKLMMATGIEYSRDPVTRMQSVLRALQDQTSTSIEQRTAIHILPKKRTKISQKKN